MSIENYIAFGDCRSILSGWRDENVKVQTVVTSPPYWGLRDYGTGTWEGGDQNCDHVSNPLATKQFGNEDFNINRPSRNETKLPGYYSDVCPKCGAMRFDKQIGQEKSPDEYVSSIVDIFDKIWEMLSDDGTIWLNIGDTYASSRGGLASPPQTIANGSNRDMPNSYSVNRNAKLFNLKHKDLVGIPWRVAFALQSRGWYLRQDIIWSKPNPVPESVKDRCTKSHEYIFLLSKSEKYYFDSKSIAEQAKWDRWGNQTVNKDQPGAAAWIEPKSKAELQERTTKNKRSVWSVATKPYAGAHFATFPPELITPCILAGSKRGDIVLDPFMGSGTTAAVARTLGRKYLGCELNESYKTLQEKRLQQIILQFDNN